MSPTLEDARHMDKRQDAAQVAIEGFWARPTGSGDGYVDVENYAPELAERIGWSGTTDELADVLAKYTLESDEEPGDDLHSGRNRAKLGMRAALDGKVDTSPVGDDPYLPHRRMSNEDAVARIQCNVQTIADKEGSDQDQQDAVRENSELRDMLLARVPGDGNHGSLTQRFRDDVEFISRPRVASRDTVMSTVGSMLANPDNIPATPDYVETAPSDDGKMSRSDTARNEYNVHQALRGMAGLPTPDHEDLDTANQYRDYAERIAPQIGYTGDTEDLADDLMDTEDRIMEPSATWDADPGRRLNSLSETFVQEHVGELPRTETADGKPLGNPIDGDPVHINMAQSAIDGFHASPYAVSEIDQYARDVAPKIGYTGDEDVLRDRLEAAVLQDADGEMGATGDLADAISPNLPQAGTTGVDGYRAAELRSQFAEGAPHGDPVQQWGVGEPGYGEVKSNRTHLFRKQGDGWQQRPRGAGDAEWSSAPGLPPSAKNIAPSTAADAMGGRCLNCGRELKDATRNGGYGPECAKRR